MPLGANARQFKEPLKDTKGTAAKKAAAEGLKQGGGKDLGTGNVRKVAKGSRTPPRQPGQAGR